MLVRHLWPAATDTRLLGWEILLATGVVVRYLHADNGIVSLFCLRPGAAGGANDCSWLVRLSSFSDTGDEAETLFLIIVRFVQTSHMEESGEGPHTGGTEALSQRIFFRKGVMQHQQFSMGALYMTDWPWHILPHDAKSRSDFRRRCWRCRVGELVADAHILPGASVGEKRLENLRDDVGSQPNCQHSVWWHKHKGWDDELHGEPVSPTRYCNFLVLRILHIVADPPRPWQLCQCMIFPYPYPSMFCDASIILDLYCWDIIVDAMVMLEVIPLCTYLILFVRY
jgi:hypothetical protein